MRSATRYKLHGTYRTPRFRFGARVQDATRGDVRIVRLSDAPIPWPIGKAISHTHGNLALVVYRGLARALKRESIQAIAHHWGVSPQTVVKWRRRLGLTGKMPAGTTVLRSKYFHEPWADEMRRKAWAKARDPVRREKIAAAKRGKPRSMETIAKMRAAATGKRASASTRRKMSAAHKARATSRASD